MTDERRQLRVVEQGEERKPPFQVRRDIAKMLRSAANATERGTSYRRGPVTYAPVRAAVLVLFDADGEPCPMAVGLDGLDEADRTTLIHDAEEALRVVNRARYMRHAVDRAASEWEREHGEAPTSWLQIVRQMWRRTEQTRSFWAAKDAADKAAHEAEYPILCDCGHRCRTLGGLKQHQQGRSHRLWVSRREASR